MSWNISVFAEQYVDGSWHYVMPLHDNFKWLISDEFDDIIDNKYDDEGYIDPS